MKHTKISMVLTPKSLNNVEELGELIGETNRTRVIASALEVAKAILKQVKEGKHVILRDESGSEKEMNFIIVK